MLALALILLTIVNNTISSMSTTHTTSDIEHKNNVNNVNTNSNASAIIESSQSVVYCNALSA